MNIDADSGKDSIDKIFGRAHTAICKFLMQDRPASDKEVRDFLMSLLE